ncbi:beta-1,3-galactosyl-O-glycosyl-glycoprotein beta-1,6-N-acetylglucosaminyltransferase 4-like isoform X1 [Anguilla anguilla]|uniref:beta-1,3-galactosyl-O-glycosyl-glycoprotein beta-1,6-N-acetylglucosaminyltransferase 4-like isoform X1 n=1 Tax=Anguilla anguilla TaxID=7936 RepID=UPI0015AD1A4C|nr:beta-1,3-galactosyl-O-glycosyl-glycoprotein beta-1,6-N-acetylglucosaminyltransferase 4-like isoform X1 [Anguilla anguilla]
MRIRCVFLRRQQYKCFIFSLSLLVVCLLKLVHIKVTVKNSFFIEPYGVTTNVYRVQPQKYDINCSAVYQMDPVEVGKSLEIRRKHIVDVDDDNIVSLTSDCLGYIQSRGYVNLPLSNEEHQFPLAYSLVVHKHASMVERILHAVYMPHNIYCIHYDRKSSRRFIAAMENLASCFPNVFIASKLESVQYANITRLNADLNCLSDLLGSKVKWKYVINLCGQDFPLKSNYELVAELKKLQGANMLESSRPSELKKQRFKFQYMLKDVSFEYQKLPVRTARTKAPPPHNIQIFMGSAYFVLSREFVSYVDGNPLVKDFLSWSADTYSPDEHFWATLVRVPGAPGAIQQSQPDVTDLMSRTRLVKWNYLEGSLYPPCTGKHLRSVCIYGAAELRWLLNYGHWFANKVDPKVDPVLIRCLEEKLLEKQRILVKLASS